MYLIFETYEACDLRNRTAFQQLNWPPGTTEKVWHEIELPDGRYALKINIKQHLLQQQELQQLVDELPAV